MRRELWLSLLGHDHIGDNPRPLPFRDILLLNKPSCSMVTAIGDSAFHKEIPDSSRPVLGEIPNSHRHRDAWRGVRNTHGLAWPRACPEQEGVATDDSNALRGDRSLVLHDPA